MDRIIYFYATREHGETVEPFKIIRYQRRDYELIRAGLAPWFVKRWETPENFIEGPEEDCKERRPAVSLFHFFSRMRRQKLHKKALEEEELFWRKQFEILIEAVDGAEGGMSDGETAFACEDSLRHLLIPGSLNGLTAAERIWTQKWSLPEFDGYGEPRWVEHLMRHAMLPHFVVLGYHPELPRLLCLYADRMKSLKWILPQRFYSEQIQEFLEDFYEEYGLAAAVQVLPDGESYKKARIACREPSNILDFSGEVQIPAGNISRESIWLDMNSLEEKCRRMEIRNTGIYYFSLKKEWKQPVLP